MSIPQESKQKLLFPLGQIMTGYIAPRKRQAIERVTPKYLRLTIHGMELHGLAREPE